MKNSSFIDMVIKVKNERVRENRHINRQTDGWTDRETEAKTQAERG